MRVLCFILCLFGAVSVWAADQPRVLFLSKSQGFQHSTITRKNGELSHTEVILQKILDGKVAELTLTKEASRVNAENLQNYDVVIFYTTLDLDKPTDKRPEETPMSATGQQELMDWIKAGGGFIGYHCASDTFHEKDGKVTPYIDMLGGEFRGHGRQFRGTVKVVDPDHPTMKPIPGEWSVLDEWYLFKNLNTDRNHVLALLDPGREREKQEMYNIPNYPVIWCSEYGSGRVYYNAMGHREDVWTNDTFQESVWEAIRWASGKGPAGATPNHSKVVPTE